MSKHNPPSFMGGSMRKKSGAHDAPHKTNKNSTSAVTSKTNSRAAAEPDTSGEGSDEDGEASSATEEAASSSDEPDVSALASARRQQKSKAALRLPGHELTGDDLFSDTIMGNVTQASPGAGFDAILASDDEDYGDLEDVSESDDDEVEMAEDTILKSVEQDLIEEFEETEQRRIASAVTTNLDVMALRDDEDTARSLGLLQSDDLFGGVLFPVDMNVDPYGGLSRTGDTYWNMLDAAEQTMWRMPETVRSRESSDPISGTQKRVRFEKTPCSTPSISEDEDPSEAFPDLFTPADDPVINQQIAIGLAHDEQRDYNDNESFYDFDDDDDELAFQIDEESNSDDDSSSYDSDEEGDTTDEETPEEQIAKREVKTTVASRAAGSKPPTPLAERMKTQNVSRTAATRSATTPRPTTPGSLKGPATGEFQADPTRAAVRTSAGKLVIQPPTKPLDKDKAFWERARSVADSRNGSPRSSFHILRSNSSDSMPSRPLTAKSTLANEFGGNLDFIRDNDISGIAEDMFPHMKSGPLTSFSSLTGTDEGDSGHHMDLDMHDLVNIDDSDSETEGLPTGAITSPADSGVPDTFYTGGGLHRRSSDLMDHFTQHRDIIGSFRQNQQFAKQLSSQALHPAQRASTHEFNALQKGRRGAANIPITPARKKRISQDLTSSRSGVRKSISSPLTNRRPRSRGGSLGNANLLQTFSRNPFE